MCNLANWNQNKRFTAMIMLALTKSNAMKCGCVFLLEMLHSFCFLKIGKLWRVKNWNVKFGSSVFVIWLLFLDSLELFIILIRLFPSLLCASFKGCTLANSCTGRSVVRSMLFLTKNVNCMNWWTSANQYYLSRSPRYRVSNSDLPLGV